MVSLYLVFIYSENSFIKYTKLIIILNDSICKINFIFKNKKAKSKIMT
ncbi:hypothetical protein BN151790114 [Staphylococcus capitis]|nr:hypothetical protein BN151790114 [Staphylococcus capitis]